MSSAGRQCTRCQHKSLDCSLGIGEGGNTSSLIFDHIAASVAEQTSPTVIERTEQEASPSIALEDSPSDDAQTHPGSAAEHLSHLLSRVREAMYGGAVSTQQESSRSANQDRGTYHGQFREILKQFPPKSVADFLSSCCYELATDSFFYFDQQDFQRKIDEVYLDESSQLRENGVFLCLVLMAFALGSQFANLKSKASAAWNTGNSSSPGRYFYSLASRLLPMATFECSIQAMQTCLVTAVYLLPEHVYDKGYLYLSHALRIAISLDMHRRKAKDPNPAWDSEISHRLWWSVFSLERTVGIKLGRPASIATSEVLTPVPRALPSLDEVQYFDNVSHQVANAKLVLIMDTIVKNLAPDTTTTSESLQKTEQRQQDLVDWKASLSPHLRLDSLRPSGKGYRTVVHLHLNFHFASILVCRSALLSLLRRDLKVMFGKPDHQSMFDSDRLERLAENCVNAARSIIGLFEMLHQTENLGMFSFTDFQGCSIATVILLLESMRRGNRANSLSTDTGFSCLRYMATENQHAKLGIQYVEELRAIANQVIEKCMQRSSDDLEDPIDSRGIDAYQTWIQTVLDGSLTLETNQQDGLTADLNTATGAAHNYEFSSGVAESSSHSRSLSNGLGQATAADGSGSFSLPPGFQFTAPSTILTDDPSDTFLFGLTGLDALDFLVSDDLLHE